MGRRTHKQHELGAERMDRNHTRGPAGNHDHPVSRSKRFMCHSSYQNNIVERQRAEDWRRQLKSMDKTLLEKQLAKAADPDTQLAMLIEASHVFGREFSTHLAFKQLLDVLKIRY